MRGFKIIAATLSEGELLQEATSDELVTTAARNHVWYFNPNPRPDDLLDKSGRNNHFSWYDSRYTATLHRE